jgi:Ca2+-binding EF-hand superfamily protein
MANLKSAFVVFDGNHDGFISSDDFLNVLQTMGGCLRGRALRPRGHSPSCTGNEVSEERQAKIRQAVARALEIDGRVRDRAPVRDGR